MWTKLWKMPQALMWERQGQEHYVALYVRRLVEAEQSGSAVNLSTLVRQMADSLGLTTPGLRANRWKIESKGASSSATTGRRTERGEAVPSARERGLRLVVDNAVEGTAAAG